MGTLQHEKIFQERLVLTTPGASREWRFSRRCTTRGSSALSYGHMSDVCPLVGDKMYVETESQCVRKRDRDTVKAIEA